MKAPAFISAFFVVLGLETTAVLALNVVVNPRGEFPPRVFSPLLQNQLQAKLELYGAREVAPRTIVFGSSRARSFAPEDLESLGHPAAFNFSLGGAGQRDVVALYRYLVARGRTPKEVFFAFDEVEKLQASSDLLWDSRTSPEIASFTGRPARLTDYAWKLLASYSFAYVFDVVRSVRYSVTAHPPPIFTIDADGFVRYPTLDARMADGGFRADSSVRAQLPRLTGLYNALERPDPAHVRELRHFAGEARRRGTVLTLLIMPIHPMLLRAIDQGRFGALFDEALASLTSLCGPGVRVYNFLTVDSFAGDSNGFYDPRHFTRKNARQMLERMNADVGNLCAK